MPADTMVRDPLPRLTASTVTDAVLDELYHRLDRVVAERDRLAERLRVINQERRG